MKYHVITYGCQMNLSDSERIAAVLESAKYKQATDINKANLLVVNACSVRQSAIDRIYGLVEKLKKDGKKPMTILTGCVLKKDEKKFDGIFDYILDIKDLPSWPKILKKSAIQKSHDRGISVQMNNYLDITPKYSNKFSANVPIMTGCNNFCAYCVVPYTRKREISRPANEIISEIKNLIENGYKEIWLLGQNVNSYKDIPCIHDRKYKVVKFPKLLKLVNNIPGKFWIRFTSSHPKDFNDEVIDAMTMCKKVSPYLNLPVQSGDNKILRAMNRNYSVADYKNKIKKLKKKIPGIAISTDIIVGFPGETKKQFENTAKLFREVKFDMAYINKYSPRAGTAAAKLKDNVSWDEKKRREKVLTDILKQTALKKNKNFIGKEIDVLINENRNENYFGKDKHYKTIKVKSSKNILGKLVNVKIIEAKPFTLTGKIL